MLDFDFILSLISYIQPPILTYIIFFFTKNFIFNFSWFEQLSFIKKKKKSIKFFECSVYSRLINYYHYDIHCLIFCILFILYDVDLIFFFSEIIFFDTWSFLEILIFIAYIGFFIIGFWYDFERYVLYWNY
jgi:NADH:ubiquinone oxidoreductase subunit 3 (subunit A)